MTSRSGGVTCRGGRVYARVRVGKKKRIEVRIPWARSEAEGAERAAFIAEIAEQLVEAGYSNVVRKLAKEAAEALTPKRLATVRAAVASVIAGRSPVVEDGLTTFGDVAKMWTSGELRQKHPDHVRAKADFSIERGRLKRYILPHVKDVPIVAFERGHGDLVMSKLPSSRVKAAGTRRHVAQIIATILNYAVMPLGLVKATPIPKGWLPRIESHRHYTCLFPREEQKLLGCKDVDEAFRLFVGVLDREGMRVSELADSEWWQWNLEVGTFTATKTKTDDPRMWALQPDVARAMRLWHERHGKTKARPFIDVVPDKKAKLWLATRLRDALKAAGVTREELFASTAHTGQMRAHDLRATFVTISLAQGKSDTWIRDRTGHKTLSMIDRYRRTARQFEELQLGALVDLVDALGWVITRVMPVAVGAGGGGTSDDESEGSGAGIRTPIRGSKSPSVVSSVAPPVANDEGSEAGDPPPKQGVTQGSPTLRRLSTDVQEYVAECLEDAFPHAFGTDPDRVLKPLARAAKAINRGRAPKARRARGGSR